MPGDLGKLAKAFMSQNAFAIISSLMLVIVIGYQRDINRRFTDLRTDLVQERTRLELLEQRINRESIDGLQRLAKVEDVSSRVMERLDKFEEQLDRIREFQLQEMGKGESDGKR